MGINGQRFSDRYSAQVKEIKIHLLDFVKSLNIRRETNARVDETGAGGDTGVGAGMEAGTVVGIGDIVLTNRGFPRLPPDVMGDLTKKQWEVLMRKYLSQHYSTSFH